MSKEKENDLTIKIFALIIAIILWSYVMSEENPFMEKEIRNIEVTLSNIDSVERQKLVIMEPKDPKITVRLYGRRNDLDRIVADDILASVDLSGYGEGAVKVPVYIEVPDEVKVVDYYPKEILFKFEKLITKDMVVNVETVGELPQGYVLGEPVIKPQSVYIEGPRSWVDSVMNVVATVDITSKMEDINVTVPIRLIDEQGNDVRGVELNQNLVDVFIPVYKIKKVPIELQIEGQLPDDYKITDIKIEPNEIDIKGKKEDLEKINSIKTKPVNINDLINKQNVVVELDLPEKISLVNPNQQITVTLNIEESITKVFRYTLGEINMVNLASNLKVDESDLNQPFTVTIKGTSSKINPINKEDLDIEVDLKDLTAGSYYVEPVVKNAVDFIVANIQPKSLSITLKEE
ncbi:YbbR domain-containing protein [Keratinibaculum paraultunense]|uniref:YbbR domain-containing protein n=1 Tax=Keratinibaculum paraultunense TaxID=1278232 RepID=A0A4V2UTL5_9FIRM|nr:CdaR family protein [Keratinibaculum paraultunense]QQY79345.1 hypothetical protein JL105_09145 [Keratinibaculum paraultunense]TCS86636.1 YbbR domain-containing protein [Keratinibaculum paraultunense]